ncbi:Gfo/Idh/MocA family protein [Devosia sp.]|uniref:Gfo/Idh/MocA family protein n=1 Tax=Devosia sp. TaxID=1871048 RepID=UPI002FCC88C9
MLMAMPGTSAILAAKDVEGIMEKVRVGLIGLGFGAEFIPIYQAHPKAEVTAICQRSQAKLDEIGNRFGIEARYTDFRDVLTDPNVDFVHINSPIPDHAPQSIAALKAGKHVMCTVPMATTLEEAKEIVGLVRETGLKYMMAETVVYSREYLFIKELYNKGELGRIQYLQASHPQDMEGWPDYWKDMVPMHYATHVVSPLMALVDGMADYVSCFGSGAVNDEIARRSGSAFAVESCHIKIKDSDVAAHVWRFLWDTARQYRESIDVYGSKKSFEWELMTGEQPVLHTAKRPEPEIAERVEVPDYARLLPNEIQKFTRAIVDEEHLSFIQGGGHGGSHPHMVNEMVNALLENRDPFPNAEQSANWTAVGICAHQSALKGGEIVKVPDFGKR